MRRLAVLVGVAFMLTSTALAQSLHCPSADDATPVKARKDFVIPFTASAAAIQQGRLQDAVSLADQAAPNAVNALQLQAALSVRSAALMALRDDIQLVPTLETRIKVGCFRLPGEADDVASQLAAARARSNFQPQQ